MKKVAVLIENQFDEQELIYPYHRLREDYDVDLIGTDADSVYRGKTGFTLKSHIASKDANADDYLGLIIPGGFSPDYMRRSDDTVELVKNFDKANKPIAAICHGPWMLASAVDLKGKKVTSFPSIKVDLEHAGAKYIDGEVVVDGNLITSRNPNDLPAFVKAFVKMLEE